MHLRSSRPDRPDPFRHAHPARRRRRPDRAAVLPGMPGAAGGAPSAVRALLARGAFHPPAAVRRAGDAAALRHGRAHGVGRGCGTGAGLRPGPGRGPLQRRHAHPHPPVQVRRPARCARAVRALAGRGRARPDRLASIVVVPVPLSRWRLLSRRFNQAAILAQELSRQTGLAVDLHLLQRSRSTSTQVGLTRDQRRRNLAGALRVRRSRRAKLTGPQRAADRRCDHHGCHRRGLRPRAQAGGGGACRRAGPGAGHQRGAGCRVSEVPIARVLDRQRRRDLVLSQSKDGPRAPSVLRQAQQGVGEALTASAAPRAPSARGCLRCPARPA